MSQLDQELLAIKPLAEKVFAAMNQQIIKTGFTETPLPEEGISAACFNQKKDPFSQLTTLEGEWRDEKGRLLGSILFHGDGSFYAEYDVVQPHPTKKNWFVESVTAWGRDDIVKTEMKLLPAVAE